MQETDVFHFHVELNGHSLFLVVDSYSHSTVRSIANQSQESVLSFDLGYSEVIGLGIRSFGDFVLLSDGDVALGGRVEKEIISYFNMNVPLKTFSRSNRSSSPTVMGICDGRGDILQSGVGGLTASATSSRENNRNIFILILNNIKFQSMNHFFPSHVFMVVNSKSRTVVRALSSVLAGI
jgi:hypothetical protein